MSAHKQQLDHMLVTSPGHLPGQVIKPTLNPLLCVVPNHLGGRSGIVEGSTTTAPSSGVNSLEHLRKRQLHEQRKNRCLFGADGVWRNKQERRPSLFGESSFGMNS